MIPMHTNIHNMIHVQNIWGGGYVLRPTPVYMLINNVALVDIMLLRKSIITVTPLSLVPTHVGVL